MHVEDKLMFIICCAGNDQNGLNDVQPVSKRKHPTHQKIQLYKIKPKLNEKLIHFITLFYNAKIIDIIKVEN